MHEEHLAEPEQFARAETISVPYAILIVLKSVDLSRTYIHLYPNTSVFDEGAV